jgi:hypothetical protein
MSRWRILVSALPGIAVAIPASAIPPPPSEETKLMYTNQREAEDALYPCAEAATRDGVYGAVEVEFRHGQQPKVRLGRTRFLRDADVACVRHALAAPEMTALEGYRFRTVRWLAVGRVRPMFPGAFLPAWRAAVADPGKHRGALAALLPPEVRITSPRCLRFRGPDALKVALDAWLEGSGGERIPWAVTPFFAFPEGWWIRIEESARLPEDDQTINELICLDRVGAAISALRRAEHRTFQILGTGTTLEAEFVVDASGRAVGEIGLCLTPQPYLYTAADFQTRKAEITSLLRELDYGRRRGFERVVLHDSSEGKTRVESRPATGPLGRHESTFEAHCKRVPLE